ALDRFQQVVARSLSAGEEPEDGALCERNLLGSPGRSSPHWTKYKSHDALRSRLYGAATPRPRRRTVSNESEHRTLSRGGLIKAAGGAGLAVAFGAHALDALGADAATTATCVLTPEVTEGPYWIDNKLTRRDIREGKQGLPLVLQLTIVNAKTCKPINAADVEIWHCDAAGKYSGFDTSSGGGGPGGGGGPTSATRYLRGHQRSNAAGTATFLTVFPGWYPGRTPHIHMKVHV